VYIPSPNGLHFRWAMKAFEAGKHVLCEKPITANAEEAEQLVAAAVSHRKVLMEAAHSFHHPANQRAREIVRSGALGDLLSVTGIFDVPLIPSSDIRYDVHGKQRQLAGGAFMDTGSYAVNVVRFLSDSNMAQMTSAVAKERFPGVDEHMDAQYVLQKLNARARSISGMAAPFPFLPSISATVDGTRATMKIGNFVAPHIYHYISVTDKATGKTKTEKVYGDDGMGRTTYEYQLQAFIKCVREQKEGGPAKTEAGVLDDFVESMKIVDAAYEVSGLKKRVGFGL